MRSPVPQEVLEELSRVVERWRQLPLDHAFSSLPAVRATAQQLADLSAQHRGRAPAPMPELGPEAVMDQLTVTVYDVFAAGPPEPAPAAQAAQVAQLLADLRRSL